MYLIGGFIQLILLIVAIFLTLAYAPGLLNINPVAIRLLPCPKFEGPLAKNARLQNTEKFLEHELDGPESIAHYDGDLYTGLATGEIVRIHDNKIELVTQIGDPSCEGKWEEDRCGRPLGMRFDKQGNLYVADAYYGIYKIDVKSGEKIALYTSDTLIDGRPSVVVNDLDVSKSGDIYFTDSSRWPLKTGIYGALEMTPKGRILHYNAKTKKTTALFGGVNFANGIQLAPDESFVLVSETGFHRILKYHLQGPKTGSLEVFADNLPGFPDNIRLNSRGGYWVPQCGTRIPGQNSLTDLLGDKPVVRKILARSLHTAQKLLDFIDSIIGIPIFLKELKYELGHMQPYANQTLPQHGMIIELDEEGAIIQSLHDPTGSVRFISEVLEHDGKLYFGSPWHTFIGRLEYQH